MADEHVAEHGATGIRAIVLERSTLLVVAVAVALRLAWVAAFARTPSGLSDPRLYHLAARGIADGDGYRSITGGVTTYYPPGYPYALGWLYRLADAAGLDGRLPYVVGLVQSLLWGVAVIAVVIIGRHVGGQACGVAAGLVLALWPNLITYAGAHLSESLFVALFACAVASCSVAALAEGDRLTPAFVVPVVIAGGLLGLAAMVRPQVLMVVPVVAAAWWWNRLGSARVLAFVVACAVGTTILAGPWAVRNARELGEPVFIASNSGDNLCLGYNPQANGGFAMYEACNTGEFYVDGPDAELRRNKENRDKALSYIADEPAAIPLLAVKKLWVTVKSDDDGLRANESYGAAEIMSPRWRTVWQVMAHIAYGLIAAATVWGTGLAVGRVRRGKRREHPMLLVLLGLGVAGLAVPMAIFGDPRFKVPSTPIFAVMAGLAIARLTDPLRDRSAVGSDDVAS